ncbi:MAG: alpha-D-ribose 1-methylphosphonate 5-triphosphate diphosphatase [Acetobacteraceae bacterium]|nr:alpha-D-ribose 1-methylphosphonate 5-triphosphate diphosphatase [Acetobacteraceae bacterium]
MTETILTNAQLILRDRVLHGTLLVRGGKIAEISAGLSHAPGAIDLDGDYLMPGVVDVHTDNLERQVQPRINARWPSLSALLSHDAQTAAAGVVTVLDALCLGDLGFDVERIKTFKEGLLDLNAMEGTGLLKSEHFLHLRCEMPALDVIELVEPVAHHPRVRMVSFMDHSPGIGQYADMDHYRKLRRRAGNSEADIEARIEKLHIQRAQHRTPNRHRLLEMFRGRDVALASHDDETVENIAENVADGIMISEFPVRLAAARAAHESGMTVIAGAPNIVRGGSHSGNVSAAELVREGVVDALASDYVPAALIEAAFLAFERSMLGLPDAVAMITDEPAKMAKLPDRGRLEVGLRADMVRVRSFMAIPVVRQVWREGERIS